MLILVGSGGMAIEYARVLQALERPFCVVGRGEENATAFESAIGVPVIREGIKRAINDRLLDSPTSAIVATSVEALAETVELILARGVTQILVEKPAGLNAEEIRRVKCNAESHGAKVYVAYNRRFFASVRMARRLIEEDGGIQSFSFEFTEWGHVIAGLKKAPGVIENLVVGNSSHVLDLAFHLGGKPAVLHALHSEGVTWHPAASRFVGCGNTDQGALFSYQANWDAPGRWGLEFCTSARRFILRPMETLQVMRKGSVAIESVAMENADLDTRFKPGIFLQTKAFLEGSTDHLCTIAEHCEHLTSYVKIAGY